MTDRRTINRRISPAIGEHAIQQFAELYAEIDNLRAALEQCRASWMKDALDKGAEIDRLREAIRHLLEDSIELGILGSKFSGVVIEARAALAKAGGE